MAFPSAADRAKAKVRMLEGERAGRACRQVKDRLEGCFALTELTGREVSRESASHLSILSVTLSFKER
jgi:hypothetical protein